MFDSNESSHQNREQVVACQALVRKELEPPNGIADRSEPIPLDFIHPCIGKKSLRAVGINASESVLRMMGWWPRVRLYTILKLLSTIFDRAEFLDLFGCVPDVLACILGEVYCEARNCRQPAEFVKIDRIIRSEKDPWYRPAVAPPDRGPLEPGVEPAISPERLMEIDLRGCDDLLVEPPEGDWSRDRKIILFLQTGLRLGFEWTDVIEMTKPYFGPTLNQPPSPCIGTGDLGRFSPPAHDQAKRQQSRQFMLDLTSLLRRRLIQEGTLVKCSRLRKDSRTEGLNKAHIVDEQAAYEWATLHFFGPNTASKPFADLARMFPDRRIRTGNPKEKRKEIRRRADQIRKRVAQILGELGLPMGNRLSLLSPHQTDRALFPGDRAHV